MKARWAFLGLGTAVLASVFVIIFASPVGSGDASRIVEAWTPAGLQRTLVHSIAVVPGQDTTYAGTLRGVYVRQGAAGWKPSLPGPEIWSVASSAGGVVAAGGEGGAVAVSHDRGRAWVRRRLPTSAIYALAFERRRQSTILAGGVGGLFRSADGGEKWKKILVLGPNACDGLVWSGRGVVLAAIVPGIDGHAPPVLISRDNGRSWHPFGARLPRPGVMSLLPVGRTILAGTMGKAVWMRLPGGASWVRSSSNMPPLDDHGAALTETEGGNASSIYVGTLGFGVYRSTDGGITWRMDSDGLRRSTSRIVLSLAYNAVERRLLAGTADGVFALSVSHR